MGCYLIKDVCSCLEVKKDVTSQIESKSGSEHDIWGGSPALRKEFESSISKALQSDDSSESCASFEKAVSKQEPDNLSSKTVKEENRETEKRTAFTKSKTFGA